MVNSRSHVQKKVPQQSASTPVQNQLRSRPFAVQAQSETNQQEVPDLQTQIETARRLGHSFSKISASTPAIIQPKLTIGAPGDKYEQEADRVAQQVVQRINTPGNERSQPEQAVQREAMSEEDEERPMSSLADQIQRVELPEEDEELQMKPMLQRQASEGAVAATTELESAIQQSRGRGQPLADDLRQPLEQAFGNVDFSRVNVHTDAQSDQLNRSIQAKAFTTGQDIYFRQGAYQPGSRGGQELIAHELTHTVQQGAVRTQRLQAMPETLPPAPIRVLQDVEKPIRRHSDKAILNNQVEQWKSPIAKTLMTGVLDQPDAGAAAGQVYNNMFANVSTFNWKYKASCGSSSGANLIEGKSDVGMCETYRNAFKYMLEQYLIPLVADYDPFMGGLTVKEGQNLVTTKFVTREGLALLGNLTGYNVDREVNAVTGDEKATNRYLFSSHWQLEVNGTTYDPLFQGDGTGNIDWELKSYKKLAGVSKVKSDEDIALVEDHSRGATSGQEFMGHYGLVRGLDAFESSMQEKAKAQKATTLLEDIKTKLKLKKDEWDIRRTHWTGKTAWRKPIQETSIPQWLGDLQTVRDNSLPDIKSMAVNPLLDRLVATTRKSQYGEKIAQQVGIARRALERMQAVTETAAMGVEFDKALEAINKAKTEAEKDEG